MTQLALLPDTGLASRQLAQKRTERSSTFVDNMSLPVHQWFRYSAGFSAKWAAELIEEKLGESDWHVLDPFAGSGTTLLAADSVRAHSIGWESHPFIHRIAQAKLNWFLDENDFLDKAQDVLEDAKKRNRTTPTTNKPLLLKCYEGTSLARLESLRASYEKLSTRNSEEWELVWLTITTILRECSYVGTAQWQYVLPNKRKAKVREPFDAFMQKAILFAKDIYTVKTSGYLNASQIFLTDARNPGKHCQCPVDLVVTSPPYPNNYDYADATRLEMMFWGEIGSWSDLQPKVRTNLIRSCSQHSAAERLTLDGLLSDPNVEPILEELEPVCRALERIRLSKGGKKTYHTMIAAYFSDLAQVWKTLRSVCRKGSIVCFVIGDSAPYGVYVPVDKWLSVLAIAAGFSEVNFEKIRDRNIKWKNRKHRVPLHEGRLWVQG